MLTIIRAVYKMLCRHLLTHDGYGAWGIVFLNRGAAICGGINQILVIISMDLSVVFTWCKCL